MKFSTEPLKRNCVFSGLNKRSDRQFILELLSIYILVLLLVSIILVPIAPVLNAEDGDEEDGDHVVIADDPSTDVNLDEKTLDDNLDLSSDGTGGSDTSGDDSGGHVSGGDFSTDGSSDKKDIDDSVDLSSDGSDTSSLVDSSDSGLVDDAVSSDDTDGTGGSDASGDDSGGHVSGGDFSTDGSSDKKDIDDSVDLSSDESGDRTKLQADIVNDSFSNTVDSSNIADKIKTFEFQKSTTTSTDNTAGNESKTDDASLNLQSSIGDVKKGETISVNTADEEKEKSCIQRIDFKTSDNQKNVTLTVSNSAEKPVEIKNDLNLSVNDQVYIYLDIKLTASTTYIGESGIDQMSFNFTIQKTWIENQTIDKYQIKMMRYHNETWQELNTSYDGETDNVIYYQAETPGLSIFAVVGNKIVEESDDVVVESTSFPWWMPTGVIIFSTTALGIVLFKKRFVYQA